MAATHPSDIGKGQLLDLPQELQDIIFDLAYPAEPKTNSYRTPKQWEHYQQVLRKSDSNYKTRPFPAPKVSQFLVSKTFFKNAAEAWVRNQHFEPREGNAWAELAKYGMLCQRVEKVTLQYGLDIHLLERLPRLKELTVVLNHEALELLKQNSVKRWLRYDDYGANSVLLRLRGLRRFRLEVGMGRNTVELCGDWAQLQSNVAVLQEYVRRKVTRFGVREKDEWLLPTEGVIAAAPGDWEWVDCLDAGDASAEREVGAGTLVSLHLRIQGG